MYGKNEKNTVIYGFIVADKGRWPFVLNTEGKYPGEPMPNFYQVLVSSVKKLLGVSQTPKIITNERIQYVLENNSHFNFAGVLFGLHRQDAFAKEAGHTNRSDCQKQKTG